LTAPKQRTLPFERASLAKATSVLSF
jgi:hypothetical protein